MTEKLMACNVDCNLWTVEEFPEGMAAIEGGKSREYITGGWRSKRAVWDSEKCTSCMLCWVMCPDTSILTDGDGHMTGIDYDHCKGCGVCAVECRFDALHMVPEHQKEA